MRILLVSQMYPGPEDPDLGVFVATLESALAERGHTIERAVIASRTGGHRRHAGLARDTFASARRFRPDVVYAHFLVPAGLFAALETRAPLVVTAHGQDVENAVAHGAVRAATKLVVRRAAGIVAVSDWLRRRLEAAVPAARGRVDVVDCGVDLGRFTPRDQTAARQVVGWEDTDGPAFLCIGSLTARKNVLRLARAFDRLGSGSLVFVGDGPLRGALEGRPAIRVVGAVPNDRVPDWVAASDVVCQPSLVEPFGLVTLEALACGRPVVATRNGGPPEFVPDGAGVLVDPQSDDAVVAALEAAQVLPRPNEAGLRAAHAHDVKVQAARIEEILVRAARERSQGR
jgi:glycosyltransferase involved in cell wall biosynthesis